MLTTNYNCSQVISCCKGTFEEVFVSTTSRRAELCMNRCI